MVEKKFRGFQEGTSHCQVGVSVMNQEGLLEFSSIGKGASRIRWP